MSRRTEVKARAGLRRAADGMGPLGASVLIVAPVVAAALLFVWTHVTRVQLGYALSKAGAVHGKLLEENRGLRIEVAALRAPRRLEQLAAERYRLAPPKTEQVVRLAPPTPRVIVQPGAPARGSAEVARLAERGGR